MKFFPWLHSHCLFHKNRCWPTLRRLLFLPMLQQCLTPVLLHVLCHYDDTMLPIHLHPLSPELTSGARMTNDQSATTMEFQDTLSVIAPEIWQTYCASTHSRVNYFRDDAFWPYQGVPHRYNARDATSGRFDDAEDNANLMCHDNRTSCCHSMSPLHCHTSNSPLTQPWHPSCMPLPQPSATSPVDKGTKTTRRSFWRQTCFSGFQKPLSGADLFCFNDYIVCIQGRNCTGLVNTSATISVLDDAFCQELDTVCMQHDGPKLQATNGGAISPVKQLMLRIIEMTHTNSLV